jgi:hypothetical protein
MNEHRHRRRVRVVTDEARHRRHLWKKTLRKVLIASAWVVSIALGLIFFWYVLERMLRPPPMAD